MRRRRKVHIMFHLSFFITYCYHSLLSLIFFLFLAVLHVVARGYSLGYRKFGHSLLTRRSVRQVCFYFPVVPYEIAHCCVFCNCRVTARQALDFPFLQTPPSLKAATSGVKAIALSADTANNISSHSSHGSSSSSNYVSKSSYTSSKDTNHSATS